MALKSEWERKATNFLKAELARLGLSYEGYTNIKSESLFEARGNTTKLKSIGWVPKHSIYDILDELIEYYKNGK